MKKIKNKLKYTRRYKRVSAYNKKKKEDYIVYLKSKNRRKYPKLSKYNDRLLDRKKPDKLTARFKKIGVGLVYIPVNFTLTDNTEIFVTFINNLISRFELRRLKSIFLDFSKVKTLEIAALFVLQTIINDERIRHGKEVRAKPPIDPMCKKIYDESSFEQFFFTPDSENHISVQNTHLMHFNRKNEGDTNVIHKLAIDACKKLNCGIKLLTGCMNVMMELMANTIQWADPGNRPKYEPWNCYVYFNTRDGKAYYVWIDNGIGIIDRLYKNTKIRYARNRINKREHEILEDILKENNDASWSSSHEENRGEGLPSVYREFYDRSRVKDLLILTNNVCLNYKNQRYETYKKHRYQGTVIYWEVHND